MQSQNANISSGNGPGLSGLTPKIPADSREVPGSSEDARQKEQRRLAPRSSNQFRVGPPFCATSVGTPVYSASKPQHAVAPKICARLDRGFDLIEGEWIGYKRNYFTLVAAFQFPGLPLTVTATDTFMCVGADGTRLPLCAFKILLTSVCLEDNSTAVTLVQHTAKRDRGPQSAPPLYYAVPGELPAHNTMKLVANIRNGDKIDRCNRLFYLLKEEHAQAVAHNPQCMLATYPRDCEILLVARYERIQFLSAGCGNRKLASTNNKHYVLVVQLLGVTDLGTNVVLASTQSPPLIVRGRSPSNYPLSEKKEPRLESQLEPCIESSSLKSNIAHLLTHDAENEDHPATQQKKRRLKALHLLLQSPTRTKQPRPVLGINQNILNAYTPEAFDPELLESPTKPNTAAATAALNATATVATTRPPVLEVPQLIRTYEERFGPRQFVDYLPREYSTPGLLIPQEDLFPFGRDSSIVHSASLFASDSEPLNITHPAFQSPRATCQNATVCGYKEAVYDINDLMDAELGLDLELGLGFGVNLVAELPYDCYLSLPVPIAFPESVRTSTPLQLQVMQPNLAKNLHPEVARCKHGFKQRDKGHSVPRSHDKVYTIADLNASTITDANFIAFKKKLSSFRLRITDQSPHTLSLRLLPLTMLSSDNEALFLRGQSRGPSFYKP